MRQNSKRFRLDVWGWTTIVILLLYVLFLLYPLSLLLKMAFSDGVHFTLENFAKFFSRKYYSITDSGKEQLIFSAKDRAQVGKQVVVAANEALASRVAPELPESITDSKVGAFVGKLVNTTAAMVSGTAMLTLSQETREMKGGFIMVDGDVEINCAFETLIRLQREKLEKEVANVLFQQ